MKKPALVIAAVAALIVAAAVAFRLTAASPADPGVLDAGAPIFDAGPNVDDAGIAVSGLPAEGPAEIEQDEPELTWPEGPLVAGVGMSVPLCGMGEKLKVFPGPENDSSAPIAELDTCEQVGSDIGTAPPIFTLEEITRRFVRISSSDGVSGYVKTKELHAAEEIDTGDVRILMPGYKCERGFSSSKDSILVKCAADACSGETCQYEEEGHTTVSGDPTVVRTDHEIPLPEGAKVSKTDVITKNFAALCCT